MKRISIRYLAGLMDGEGCIDFQSGFNKVSRTLYIRPRVRISMCRAHDLMMNIQNNFGGHVRSESRNNPNWSDYETWSVAGKSKTSKFLRAISKHLIIKKEQALFALWWLENMSGRQIKSEGYQKINKIRQFALEEMKLLKSDSHRLSERAIRAIELMR